MRTAKVEFQVAKNTLLRIASERNKMTNVDSKIFNGQTAVAFGYEDEVATAKAITDYIATSKVAVLKSAILGGRSITAEQVEGLSKIKGGKLQSKVKWLDSSGPLASAYGLLTAPLRDLTYVLQARADQLNSETSAE